jgi:hypothetical protein
MKMPDETHSGNNNRSKVVAQPESGTRAMAGKSNEADGALIKGPAAEAVTTAKADDGACVRAANRQINGPDGKPDSNPKKQLTGSYRQES